MTIINIEAGEWLRYTVNVPIEGENGDEPRQSNVDDLNFRALVVHWRGRLDSGSSPLNGCILDQERWDLHRVGRGKHP